MGELNWKQFLADEVTEMRGHLLKYPLNVDRMGKVTSLPGCKTFPDLGGEIGGAFLPIRAGFLPMPAEFLSIPAEFLPIPAENITI